MLVFGAADHVGGPLADYITKKSPDTPLRLATSSSHKTRALAARYPAAEVISANYFDFESLKTSLGDVHGVFVITPDFFDELTAMSHLIDAVRHAGTVRQIVRICADTPGMSLDQLPRKLYRMGPGPAHQHFEAQLILKASGLPVTLLNSLGYFMDDFTTHFSPPLKQKRMLVVPHERQMCFTDTRDLGEVAARLLLDDPDKHVGNYYEMNSGEPPITFRQVAEMIAEVTGESITYDPSPETFLTEMGPIIQKVTGDDRAADYFLVNWEMERDHQHRWFGSPFAETILGRKPTRLRSWFEEHRVQLL